MLADAYAEYGNKHGTQRSKTYEVLHHVPEDLGYALLAEQAVYIGSGSHHIAYLSIIEHHLSLPAKGSAHG